MLSHKHVLSLFVFKFVFRGIAVGHTPGVLTDATVSMPIYQANKRRKHTCQIVVSSIQIQTFMTITTSFQGQQMENKADLHGMIFAHDKSSHVVNL